MRDETPVPAPAAPSPSKTATVSAEMGSLRVRRVADVGVRRGKNSSEG